MTDTVLIIGAGVTGLHAAQECAAAGARAIVVERGPIVGGRLAAAMTKATAIGDRAEGEPVPLLEALENNDKIEIITSATLEKVNGRPGSLEVSIVEHARFVTDACTRCKLCHGVCPVVLPNEFDAGLTFRKAIYTPMLETMPKAWVIDIENCLNTPPNYLPCNRCKEVCEDDAIHFDQALSTIHNRHVGAIILAPGFRVDDAADFADFGYGSHPDIVTSAELQRLLESPGPTGGYASKPSDEAYPESVLLVLDNPSPFTLYIVASQAHQLVEQDVEEVAVLILSQPTGDTGTDAATLLSEMAGIQANWGTMLNVNTDTENALEVSYEDFSAGKLVKHSYDMIVLCTDVAPPEKLSELAEIAGIEIDDNGYLAVTDPSDENVCTVQPGVFVAGCASGPKNIKSSIAEARAASRKAIAQLAPVSLVSEIPTDSGTDSTLPPPTDDMRAQIEKLLHALINQPNI
jgi:heterodisulfide reductase subunit A